jgi:hypothetical protein
MQRQSHIAGDYFETAERFRQVCGDANSQANNESSMEFAGDMVAKANQYGLNCFITEKQLKWLCRLADIDIPPRRN